MTSREVAKFIKDAVKEMAETDNDCTYHLRLDDNLAIFVGWGDGFDENDECAIHSKSQPSYCICVKVAEYNPYDLVWEGCYMPWYKDDGEVYDTDTSISPNGDYYNTAKWLMSSYREIKKLLKQGVLTF